MFYCSLEADKGEKKTLKHLKSLGECTLLPRPSNLRFILFVSFISSLSRLLMEKLLMLDQSHKKNNNKILVPQWKSNQLFLFQILSTCHFSLKSVNYFVGYPAKRKTNRQSNADENTTSLVEVKMHQGCNKAYKS